MAAVTPVYADFIDRYPAFITLAKGVIDSQLLFSTRLLEPTVWDTFYFDGVLLDAAHNLVINTAASTGINSPFEGAAGPVNSVSAGGMSASFGQLQFSVKSIREQYYSKTVYGQQLLRLWNCVVPPVYM